MKSAVMATVTVIWAIYMLVALMMWIFQRGEFPNPAMWGVPGGIWLTLNPPFPIKKKEEESST